jgi:hypothetical protein
MALVEVRQRFINYLKTKMAMDLNLKISTIVDSLFTFVMFSNKISLYANHASFCGIHVVVPNFGNNCSY